jgi:hypothetical protein
MSLVDPTDMNERLVGVAKQYCAGTLRTGLVFLS